MSRPKPQILLFATTTTKLFEVLHIEDGQVYVLLYRGEPATIRVSLRDSDPMDGSPWKYPGCQWSNPGHCINAAVRYNRLFKTNDFSAGVLRGEGTIPVITHKKG